MDEWTLNDLLECSVCLERLDTSSKVLPCQHTFCRKCLEEIVSTHKELRCPECRILVDAQIDDLPPNVLLMRILEGMKNSGNPLPQKKKPGVSAFPKQQGGGLTCPQGPAISAAQNIIENNSSKVPTAQKQNTQPNQPFARAIYDYVSKEAGDLSFRKGDVILLHRKVDAHWGQGECEGKTGIFPLSFVQVIISLPNQVATCRALYDFRMANDDEEGCLSFKKDEVITVIRRVDENWAEGKLNDHIGIFPLAFVEMNNVAQALMKLSIHSQPGSSRIAPPTPNGEESTPLIPTDHSAVVSTAVNLNSTNQYNVPHDGLDSWTTTRPLVSRRSCAFNSGSTVSSTSTSTPTSSVTSSNSSSNTSSNSNSAPNSPPTSQPPQAPNPNPNPFLTTSQTVLQTSHITNASHEVLPTTHIIAQPSAVGRETLVDTHCLWAPGQPGEPSNLVPHPKEKRHSFSAVTPTLQSNKQSNEGVNSEAGSDSQNGQLNRHGSQRHRRSGSDLSAGVNLPAGYLALYPYKPQKADELELKKGGLYLVTERCQDGWFKGTSYRTQKSGVFPGNYVTLAKSVGVMPSFRVRDGRGTLGAAQAPLQKGLQQQKTLKFTQVYGQLVPPELPPRASSPSARPQRTSFHSSLTSWQQIPNDVSNGPKNAVEGTGASQAVGGVTVAASNGKPQSSAYGSPAVNPASTPTKSAEKVKEKKEKSGLIKRLTAMKRSKSPTESASYSMDNPVFDDAPAGSHQVQVHGHSHPVHLRSGSCPSQLIAVKAEGGSSSVRVTSASVSARLKHKERPSVSNAHFTPGTSRPLEGSTVAKVGLSTGSSHRKSNSLDAGDTRKPKQLVPPVRERFRCIVPYPPNSEYELELKVGDIIYVHRKREDGWYKGTQQRTGRTGLFPASFVETY